MEEQVVAGSEVPAQLNEVSTVADATTYNNIIKALLASGAKRINGVRIKNVNTTAKENHTMVSFTLTNQVRGYVSEDNGTTYKLGMTNTIYTSVYAIAGALKEDDELAFMANAIIENPKILTMLLSGAVVDLIQQEVVAGEEYRNPFSTRSDAEPSVYDHDIIINNIIRFKIGTTGREVRTRLIDKTLGF
jgi:hypothetical protein